MPDPRYRLELIPITNWWWVLGWALLTLLVGIVAVRVRPKGWRVLWIPLTVVTALATVGFAVNIQFQAFRTLGPLLGLNPYDTADDSQLVKPSGQFPRGAVIETTIPGPVSGVGNLPATVWLPPQWFSQPERRFPVLYLLHGTPGAPAPGLEPYVGPSTLFTNANADDAAQLAATRRDEPVVLVAPVVSRMEEDSECVDGALGKWHTYLTQDVPAWVTAQPRMETDAEHAGIAGYSMGGFCAQVAALRHPSLFSLFGNLSGTVKVDYATSSGGYPALFGVADPSALVAENDSINIIRTQPDSRSVHSWLRTGNADDASLLAAQQEYAATARELGMEVVISAVPGGHDFGVWQPGIHDWITWATDQLYADSPNGS